MIFDHEIDKSLEFVRKMKEETQKSSPCKPHQSPKPHLHPNPIRSNPETHPNLAPPHLNPTHHFPSFLSVHLFLLQKEAWPEHKRECKCLQHVYPRVPTDSVRLTARIIFTLVSFISNPPAAVSTTTVCYSQDNMKACVTPTVWIV